MIQFVKSTISLLILLFIFSCNSEKHYSGYFPGIVSTQAVKNTVYLKPYYQRGYLHIDLNYKRPLEQKDVQLVLLDGDLKFNNNNKLKGYKKNQKYWLINFDGTDPQLFQGKNDFAKLAFEFEKNNKINFFNERINEFGFREYSFKSGTARILIKDAEGNSKTIKGSCAFIKANKFILNGKKYEVLGE